MKDTTVEKKVKTKKHKVDWKMFYPIIGILLFGALSLIAFVSMGFGVKNSTTVLGAPVSLLIPIGNLTDHNPTYGATVAGIVIAWITIIVPFAMMFWSPSPKLTKWLGIIPMVLTVLAGVLMLAGIGLFIRDFQSFDGLATYKVNGGAIAGIVVVLVIGWLIALAGITRGFFNFNFWTVKMFNKTRTNKENNPQSLGDSASTSATSTTNPKLNNQTTKVKPVVQQESSVPSSSPIEPSPVLSEIDDDQTITIGGFNQNSTPIK
ncbi:hypothetical protein LD125_00289 [Mesoplasma sp. JKS002658]|uniref:hypothetical protein n=1 Tax=Mesoplasma whartonense TaxID=2878854 RepID=UPI002022A012|nr:MULTISPECIES: hypothetical protein [unclassified Mesoplasma]MCL8211206.1 hypothetical protein [Mesoplasma sp. JKS002664]MCL8211867.1 hypothetical protein [Mesoplasma sp. JKS002662]MCL8214028.1 hypothetical protein [Mesoplasma sp. JKS002658]MCL8214544.1 hypothetical protein [Mesoplasma sp. JKS002663]MCL8215347.1 hypothetical protein [Mesoplasma sp. JKS002659]